MYAYRIITGVYVSRLLSEEITPFICRVDLDFALTRCDNELMTDDELRAEYADALAAATRTISKGLDDLLDATLTSICERFDANADDAPITLDAQVEVAGELIRLALIDAFAACDIALTSTA